MTNRTNSVYDLARRTTIAAAVLCCVASTAAWPQEAVRPQVVDFTLPDVDGNPLTLSNYRGRWVIINFWATWCGPCLQEIPELNWFFERNGDRATVIGVNYEDIKTRSLKNFISKHRIDYPIVRIGATPLVPFEPLVGLPSTFFVSPGGEYVARHVGAVTARDIKKFIDKFVDKAAIESAAVAGAGRH